MTGLGHTLRMAREAQGLAASDVERGTPLSRAQVAALEAEAWNELPAPFYTRNLVRQYAAFLDLPADRLVALYPYAESGPRMDAPFWLVRPARGWGVWLLSAGVALLLLALLYGLVQAYRPADPDRSVGPVIVIVAATPTLTPAATPVTPTPAGTVTGTPRPGSTPLRTATPGATPRPGTPTPTVAAAAQATVPSVVGAAAASAESQLRAAGFAVTRQEATNPASAGQVIQQSPAGGTQRPRGEAVVIVVSRGPVGITVPNVVGLQQAQAIAALQTAGVRVNTTVNRQGRDQVPDTVRTSVCIGCVLSTSPAAGTVVDTSVVVNLAVRAE